MKTKNYQERCYTFSEAAVFRKTSEKWGGLSNMAGGYPIFVNGNHIRSTEALYQACRFPHLPEIQKEILAQKSPMTAKMVSKPYRNLSRKDWFEVRVIIMKWCLRVKLVQNWYQFSTLLKETRDLPIVENSSRDDFWGAIPMDKNTLQGVNALGRLLMGLRQQVIEYDDSFFSEVKPPHIESFKLLGNNINVLHKNDDTFSRSENKSLLLPSEW